MSKNLILPEDIKAEARKHHKTREDRQREARIRQKKYDLTEPGKQKTQAKNNFVRTIL